MRRDRDDPQSELAVALADIQKLEAWEADGPKTTLLLIGVGVAVMTLIVIGSSAGSFLEGGY